MSLVTKLSTKPTKPIKCLACDWINSRPAEEQAAIAAVVNNPDWTASAIWRILAEEGCNASESTFRAHVVRAH